MASVVLAASMAAMVVPVTESPGAVGKATIRTAIESVAREAAGAKGLRQAVNLPRAARVAPAPPRRRSAVKIIAGVLLGGAAGFFAGGYTGIAIENTFSPCNCDDPGLMGAIIGAPIGAVVGAVAGGFIAR